VGVGGDLGAHRAGEQIREAAGTPGAHHDQARVFRGGDQGRGGAAGDGGVADVQPRVAVPDVFGGVGEQVRGVPDHRAVQPPVAVAHAERRRRVDRVQQPQRQPVPLGLPCRQLDGCHAVR
jgi:hypothetical protein